MRVTPIGKKATLSSVVGDEVESHLLENMGTHRFYTAEFQIVAIDPREWYVNSKKGDLTIEECFNRLAKKWQKDLVKTYRKDAKELVKTTVLVIDGDVLEDGFHRLVAYAKEGLEVAYAIDLSQPAENGDLPLHDEETGEITI